MPKSVKADVISLNPYSYGMKIERLLRDAIPSAARCLNPYSYGMKIEHNCTLKPSLGEGVLILILME